MKKEKCSLEVAQKELDKWFDYLDIDEEEREDKKAMEKILVKRIMKGDLVLQDDFTLKFTLPEPVMSINGDEIQIDKLFFKPRIKEIEIEKYMKGEKSDDANAMLTAYICASVGKGKGVMKHMYSTDYNVCKAVVTYFFGG